ncbi:unnamed protein product [Clavelina lepadiformis]|uniref:Mitochondrial inner membrane protease subunit n=1 Tax=Clavelina lepadiformis TaxID=159417 RepID=A0ABP0FA31_CLALP
MNKSLVYGLGTGFIAYVITDTFFEFLTFFGPSMEPTIRERDIGVGEKITSFAKLRRGDIVTVTAHDNPSQRICKRIIALEGERVSYISSVPIVDDEDNLGTDFVTVRRFVPRGHVWLEGDNSAHSLDSRQYGPIPLGLVRSRVIIKLLPMRDFRWFQSTSEDA